MADAQTLRQVAQTRTPFSTWLGVVLLFLMFGLIVLATIGPSRRGTDYEEKRAANRLSKLQAQREQDHASLTSYAWVDKNKGTVRIPIDRAIEITTKELAAKKPAAAGPIATPPAQAPVTASGVATPPGAVAPPASPSPSLTPKGMEVEGHGSKAQPAAARTPPGAAPGTQPGAAASPAASQPPAAVPPTSPPPLGTPTPPGSPLPVRGATPGGQ
ncbi:MAG TPA: hypothetical protein VJ719_13570 [Chthoniobacterales bacterium]|nr:hypothetical protein [Chthoniobacterales bacterium]